MTWAAVADLIEADMAAKVLTARVAGLGPSFTYQPDAAGGRLAKDRGWHFELLRFGPHDHCSDFTEGMIVIQHQSRRAGSGSTLATVQQSDAADAIQVLETATGSPIRFIVGLQDDGRFRAEPAVIEGRHGGEDAPVIRIPFYAVHT